MSEVVGGRRAVQRTQREIVLRNARLVSGLILMTFVTMHLANHALGLFSLETAEQGRRLFLAIWRNPLGTLLLFGSVVAHATLSLLALFQRRSLVMPAREWAQLLLGLAIPLLIAEHVIGTRVTHELYGADDTYAYVVQFWSQSPSTNTWLVVALLTAWAHGCLGLYFWLRYRPWYPRAATALVVAAVLLPVLALLGFADMGQTVAANGGPAQPALDPELIGQALATKDWLVRGTYFGYALLILAVLGGQLARNWRIRRNSIEVRYPGGRVVRVPKGFTVLDASRLGNVFQYAVCGGRGRCSTCRVRVYEGLEDQPAPGPVETATLRRIDADPDVRLACQLRPTAGLSVAPLLAPPASLDGSAFGVASDPGHEQVVAVLFCDLRSFTSFADQRLPFDVVFLLNRYFGVIGRTVEGAGGRLDKFIGDGAMALFGLNSKPDQACRDAFLAAAAIVEGMRRLSEELSEELRATLNVAIGIHVGQAIVGSMGYGRAMSITAIGDTINIGSRLEAAAKEFDAEIVISEAAAKLSGLELSDYESRQISVRGRGKPLGVYVVPRGASPPRLPETSALA